MKRPPSRNAGSGAWALCLALACSATACGRTEGPDQAPGQGATGGAVGATEGGAAGAIASGQGGESAVGDAGAGDAPAANSAGPRPLRLLTQREYKNTINDLLGAASVALPDLPADVQDFTSGFAFHSTATVTEPSALQYRGAAEAVAQAALTNIGSWLPCATSAGSSADSEAACLSAFFAPTGFASKLYRRPLSTTATTGEVDRLTALYQAARAAGPVSTDISESLGLVIEAMLQTPGFLYHWELDPGPAIREGSVVKLGNYEIANRLSYVLWGTMPDTTLFAAAAAGQLGDLSSVESQVRRMLKDPKAAGTFADFFSDWLDLDTPVAPKDPSLYPQYNDALAAAMTAEVQSFVNSIVVDGSGRFDEILTGTSSFANQDLAALYGITGVRGSALVPVSLDPAQRSGLFTTAAFLSLNGAPTGSDPPRRGNAIYERLLCEVLPASPPNMPAVDPPTPGGGTTRQRFDKYDTMACATACHAQIDPLGFAFENYDGIGAYRTTDNGAPVDPSATVTLDGHATTVADARGLLSVMATSDEVQTCFARQWLRYGLGRLETADDLSSLNAAASAFKSNMRDIRELVVAVATSSSFRYRTPGTGEVLE
jgi:Protein of unknown function (DUF1592)/Protein of unknown function (DUF1588)/Protein of unknown function (DUF1585)/Protein of unknown function (DUF1595)/Protein of unknown function (DUF1587)